MGTILELDRFTRAYFEAALWSSTDDNGNPLNESYDIPDFAPEAFDRMVADCEKFQRTNAPLLAILPADVSLDFCGHDFWLTRCGHGAGFWDGDWSEPFATHFDNYAQAAGNVDLYVGDDGKIYCA